MNTKIKIAAAITALGGVAYFSWLVSFAGSTIALQELFPDIDPDVVRRAHKVMVKKVVKGEYENFDADDEAMMEQLFLKEVAKLTSS